MSWILVALFGYFLNAVSSLLDKFLLAGRIPTPAVFAFFVSLFSLVSFAFAPFGLAWLGFTATGIFLLSGVVFLASLVFLYQAIQGSELSRVAPLVGVIASFVTLCAGTLGIDPSQPTTDTAYLALLFLILGGFLLAFDLPLRRNEHFSIAVVWAGLLLGASLLLLKFGYANGNFVSGLVWSRLGIFLGGISLLLIPLYRREIRQAIAQSKPTPRGLTTSLVFIVNKTCAGIASFLVVYAASLGPIAFVQALSGMQYLFLFLLLLPLSRRFPRIFHENLLFSDWLQKGVAIVLVGLGLWFGGMSGIKPL